MIPSKYTFRTQEVQLKIPKQGIRRYLIETKNYINYSGAIRCDRKKEINISIEEDEEQPYIRSVKIEIEKDTFKFSDGSFAMQDIIKRTASVYETISLELSYKGKIVAIQNIEDLQQRWSSLKEYLTAKYKGDQVERFIQKTDDILNSEDEIIKDLLLYQNFGGLLKSIYQKYSSDTCSQTSQYLTTKYGKVTTKEEFLLQSANETEDVQLQLQSHYPEKEEYVSVNGTYNFSGLKESWLKRAVISCIEKYGRQEYHNTISIIQL
ncbi:hypothetical protein [Aquimarina litoralis]|uniref:hypothetical protein n=1 Tax=Aquimarina litoralis TaxID=584605 RepID=UPI001C570E57|nr:hypothetical protein [Aquimarina litoralis]MBW1295645.1 hypothetical protein [Aquimarina litoralis]